MNYYAAKFKREAMENPSDWVIRPVGIDRYVLDFVGTAHPLTTRVSGLDMPVEDMDYLREQDYGMMP